MSETPDHLPELFIANKNYSSWSLRPWVLMRQLGLEFTEHLVEFKAGSNWTAFRRFSPSGRVPCLHDSGTVVWDSLAIAEYLAERHAGRVAVWPADPAARAWARCAASEMHSGFPALRGQCGMNCGVRVKLSRVTPELRADLDRVDELWCEGLRRFGGPFLAGASFGAVDAFFCPVAFRVQTYGLHLTPDAAAYAQRLLALPAMQDWYAAALDETWRDAEHETEITAWGQVVQDLRAT